MKFVGREEILAAIRYRNVDCPDAGNVSVLDYISAGAIGDFSANRSNPEAALAAVIRASLKDSDAFATLSLNDHAAIARHLARTTGVEEQFDARLQKSSLTEAFVGAIEESSDWRSHLESEDKFRSSMEKWMRPYNSALLEIARNRSTILEVTRHSELVRQFETSALASIRLPLADLESFHSVAQSSARMAREIQQIHLEARANLDRWNVLKEQFASNAQLVSSLTTRRNELIGMIDRLDVIKPIMEPITNLSASFADIASQMRGVDALSDTLLGRFESSLAESNLLTQKTSEFFSRSVPASALHLITPGLPPEAIEQEEEIQEAYEEGETILHEGTSLVIVEGTSLVENIRGIVGDEFKQRLGKYEAIFERFEKLSNPPAFKDCLNDFSLIASREHWKSLWADPGKTWLPSPERLAKVMLDMYLRGQWYGVAFVGQEIANGDGYVDILVNFLGRDYIIELKMIGGSWPVSHAESGFSQLEQYMANYQSQEAYLVVFDGRKTGRGRQLPKTQDTEHGTIHVVVVPAYFDAPSTH